MDNLFASLFDSNNSTNIYYILFIPILTTFLLYILTRRDPRVQKHLQKLKGPLDLPILGSALQFIKPNEELMRISLDFYEKYGSLFKIWIGNKSYVAISKGSHVEKLLSSQSHLTKSSEYDFLGMWLGKGLLTAKPKKWHTRRKLLTPAFHFKILEEFNIIFNEQGNTFVEILRKDKCNGEDGGFFDIFPYITKCTLDIISESAMGINLNAQKCPDLDYVKAVYGIGEILIRKVLRPWLQIPLIWKFCPGSSKEKNYIKTLHSFTEKVIKKRKEERQDEQAQKENDSETSKADLNDWDGSIKKRPAFLDLLLDASEQDKSLTDLEIREEVDTFMFEGHDTTSANLVWTILLLGLYPEHQKKVQTELDEIIGSQRNRDITSADMSKMKYLEYCIKESLRLYPSVPFFIRRLTEDLDLGKGNLIPKDTSVVVTAFTLHRDSQVFPDPEIFNPNRFLPQNCIGRHPYAFVPFSAGPRNCIGQKFALLEEKVILAKFFLNFNVQAQVKTKEEVLMVPDVILRPFKGVFVKLTPRNS